MRSIQSLRRNVRIIRSTYLNLIKNNIKKPHRLRAGPAERRLAAVIIATTIIIVIIAIIITAVVIAAIITAIIASKQSAISAAQQKNYKNYKYEIVASK